MCDSRIHYSLLIATVVLTSLMARGCHGDLCIDYDEDEVMDHIHEQSTPKGGVYAGIYTKDPSADSLEKCLVKCCETPLCGATFYHDSLCLLIECNTTVPDACKPETRTEKKFMNSYLINVRSLAEVQVARSSQPVPDEEVENSEDEEEAFIKQECSPKTGEGCGSHEECQIKLDDDEIGYFCVCESGYNRILDKCVSVRNLDMSCEYGLSDTCERHEECRSTHFRSRSGECECVDGYERDDTTGWCQKIKHSSTKSSQTSSATTTTTSTAEKTTTKQKPSSTTTPKPQVTPGTINFIEPLVVSVGDDKILTLPKNTVTLDAYALPKDTKDEYAYHWSLVTQPEGDQIGEMVGINTSKLKLSGLIQGLYTFKISVTADGKYGEAFVNVTVNPPERENQSPVAVVKPAQQQVNQPSDVVLDGSESTDDDKVVKYHWEQASGPVNTQKIDDSELEKAMIVLKGLNPGEYRFKLTVTDSDGASDSSFANVTVIKETDYPPKANAGSPVILNLPQNSATLYGNSSTDDKEIVSYEWIKKSDDKLAADVTGTRTPVLHLENLELGDYLFTLKVTDSAGQSSTADVNVFVRPERNRPPVANAGISKTIWMPIDEAILDGSNSTDDQKVTEYLWKQVSGPTTVNIQDADKVQAKVDDLKVGEYKFSLTVKDKDDLESTSKTTITIKENENLAPQARAGGNQEVTLPAPLVTLDGSSSSDDKEIVSYTWTRGDSSLAAGDVVNRTDHQAILQLTNLVAGRYEFTLEVVDAEGEKDTDTANIIVRPGENREDLLELELAEDIGHFTVAKQHQLEQQLELLLHTTSLSGDTHVVVYDLDEAKTTGNLLVTFKVETIGKEGTEVMEGLEVKEILRRKIKANNDVIDFSVLHLDTVVCQNNCSGHGQCDQHSKVCFCEAFWMENFFKAYLMEQSNCDWSVLYVIIGAMTIVVSIAALIWACFCLWRRWYRLRPKKRHRYTLLEEIDDNKDEVAMLPKGKIQSSSLMVSESDFSSDEETLFINKKTNGHVKNGLVKSGKSKVRT